MISLVALPILIPLIAAAVMLLTRNLIVQRCLSFVALSSSLAVAVVLLVDVWSSGNIVVARLGGWPGSFAITLVADRLASVLVVVAMAVTLVVLLFALGQQAADEHSSYYHPRLHGSNRRHCPGVLGRGLVQFVRCIRNLVDGKLCVANA
jgi:multicomponent Na+:H+ antiporter subunit D